MSDTQTDTFRQNTHTNRPSICMYWKILEGDSEIKKDAPLAGKWKVSEKTFLLGSVEFSYREKIIMPLT